MALGVSLLAATLGAGCAGLAMTPAQRLGFDRWEQCNYSSGIALQTVRPDGQLVVSYQLRSDYEAFVRCDREAQARQGKARAAVHAETAAGQRRELFNAASEIARRKAASAPASLAEVRDLFREVGDHRRELQAIRLLLADGRASDDGGLTLIDDGLRLARDLRDARQQYELLGLSAQLHRDAGRIDASIEASRERLALVASEGGQIAIAETGTVYLSHGPLVDLAWAHAVRGEYEAASGYARRAVDVPNLFPGSIASGQHVNGHVRLMMGDYGEAERALQAALQAATTADNPRQVAAVLNSLGDLRLRSGRLDEALSFFDRAAHLGRQSGDEYVTALMNAGWARVELNQLAEAHDVFSRVLEIRRLSVNQRLGALRQLGIIARFRGQHDEALRHLTEALDLARGTELERSKALVHRQIGYSHLGRKRFHDAEEHFRKAYEISRALQRSDQAVLDLRALTRLALARGDLAGARRWWADLEQRSMHSYEAWTVSELRGQIAERSGALEDALQAYDEAAAQVERLREGVSRQAYRAGFVESRQGVYASLVNLTATLGLAEMAFHAVERAKARAFLDLLAQRRLEERRSGSPAVARYQALEGTQRRLEARLGAADPGEAPSGAPEGIVRETVETLRTVTAELAKLEREIAGTNQTPLTVAARPVEVSELRRRLAPGVVLLNYYVDSRATVVTVLARDTMQVVPLDRVEPREVLALAKRMADPTDREWQGAARQLHDRLLAPVAGALADARRLIL